MKLRPVLAFAAAGSLGALVGCVVINKEHCAQTGTACVSGTVCSVCAIENNGCVVPDAIAKDCLFAGSTGVSTDVTTTTGIDTTDPSGTTLVSSTTSSVDPTSSGGPTTEPTTLSGTDTVDSTGSSSTTNVDGCMGEVVDNADCGGDAPYCVDMQCVGCGAPDFSCLIVEPSKPTCDPASGRCVQCLSSDDCTDPDQPFCDPEGATCVPCTEHEHCPTTACNLETGVCFPDGEDDILYVYNNGSDPLTPCSDVKLNYGLVPGKPLCTLPAALKLVVAGKPTTIKLRNAQNPQKFNSGLPAGNFIVAIVPYDAQVPALRMVNVDPALTLSSGNTVFMHRVGIYNDSSASDPAIKCTGASLWLDRQRINNTKRAILADNCLLHLRRTIIFANSGGGLDIGGSDPAKSKVWLENSFVTENTGSIFGALRLGGTASAELVYTTVALNKSPVAPIDCALGWSGKLEVRNSVITDPFPRFGLLCGMVKPITSFESDLGDKDSLNDNIFTGFLEGFYSAKKGGDLLGKAVWKSSDPLTDYNDTKRPIGEMPNGDYAGGDVP